MSYGRWVMLMDGILPFSIFAGENRTMSAGVIIMNRLKAQPLAGSRTEFNHSNLPVFWLIFLPTS